jgi:hypothetical protein
MNGTLGEMLAGAPPLQGHAAPLNAIDPLTVPRHLPLTKSLKSVNLAANTAGHLANVG